MPMLLKIEPVLQVTTLCYPFQIIHGSVINGLVEKHAEWIYTYPLCCAEIFFDNIIGDIMGSNLEGRRYDL